jgi:hypothetical protein
LSPEIVDEYARVAKILADGYPGFEINPILPLILTNSDIIQAPALPFPVWEDPDDDKFLPFIAHSSVLELLRGHRAIRT